MSKRYELNETQLVKISRLCRQEQGTVRGSAAEASLMANLLEGTPKYAAKYGDDIYTFVRESGWFSRAAYWMDNGSTTEAITTAVRDVLVNGRRTLPEYIDEHDCFSDILTASNDGKEIEKTDRAAYVPDVTRIKNRFGSTYTFYCFPDVHSDPFGYTKTGGDKMIYRIDQVIAAATAEIGYLEKKSNKQLDDKTANAGSKNYTKYGRDLVRWLGAATGDTFGINYQWCQQFIEWIFIIAYGQDAAYKLLGGWTAYTPTGSGYFKDRNQWITKGPQRGDIIYFRNSERIHHVGIVTGADREKVYTIEGNTSGASDVVSNGGGVCAKSYDLSNSRIAGYGRPAYGDQKGDNWGVMDNRTFIRNMYVSELYREPKEEEINSWISAINNGMTYNTVLEGFRNSPEGKKAWITMMYKTLLERDPDQDGLEAWTKAMKGGMSRADVLQGFMKSKEYKEYHRND